MFSLGSLSGFKSGIIIFFRSTCGDVRCVKSILLLFSRNSIPPDALPVGNEIDFVCSSLVFVSLVFCVTRGVITVSDRTVGKEEKCRGDASSFVNEESRRSFDKLTGVEKLVLIVNG